MTNININLNLYSDYTTNKVNYKEWLSCEGWKIKEFASLLVKIEPDDMKKLEDKIISRQPPFDFINADGTIKFIIGTSLYNTLQHKTTQHNAMQK